MALGTKKTKQGINNLVEKYKRNRDNYLSSEYNETLLRSDFLDPLFEILGWDIKNCAGKPTNEREVILEESLKENVSKHSKKPDYTFRLFSERKFFLEAKKPSVHIENNADTAKQVRRYGFSAKLKISVLSNFEYLAVYDCSVKVEESDLHDRGLIKLYHYTEYENNFEEIQNYLGHASVYSGKFDKIWEHIEKQLKLFSVDNLFLEQINAWRLLLGTEIYGHSDRNSRNCRISEEDLNDTVQSYLNSVIFLRVCEDRNLEEYQTLLQFAHNGDFQALIDKFTEADRKYDSGLFDQKFKKQVIENSGSAFWKTIKQLYYPESPYSFSVFSSDILGNIYEIFLTKKLTIKDGEVELKDKPEHINRDVITTPTFVIQDILRETVIPFCKGKSDIEILSAKFADISCGSGAFLLELYQLLNDILIDYYLENDRTKLIQTTIDTYKLPLKIKKQILKNCIWGIDKDYNAVEASKFGLLLKLLESENKQSVGKHKPILPDLSNNIQFGNTLLNSRQVKVESQKNPLFNSQHVKVKNQKNPFDFGGTKYDVIVGNPPYMKSEDMKTITPEELPLYKKFYKSAYKQFDKYFLFIEKGLDLLKDGGYFGYVIPGKFAKVGAGRKLRNILSNSKNIFRIISFGANQIFQEKTTYTCLLILKKTENKNFEYFEVKNLNDWKVRNFEQTDFEKIPVNLLDDDVWILVPHHLKLAFEKICDQKSIALEKLIGSENIFNGIQTSANNIYIHKAKKEDKNYFYFNKGGKEWKIEKELTKPYYKTSTGNDNLNTYRPFAPNSFVIYPYRNKANNGIEFIKIGELRTNYPFAYQYLEHHKNQLDNDKRNIKPEPETPDEWYRYGRHQSLDKCNVPAKIIVGVLSLGNKYAIDYHGTLISSGGTAGYCVITLPRNCDYSIYYLQALLNSKYLEWYSALTGEVFRGGYIARGTKVLKKLPIRTINFNDKKEKVLHDSIVKFQKELIETQSEIDKNYGSKRILTILDRQFQNLKNELDEKLKNLFNLENDDNIIPLISRMYGTN